MNRLQRFVVINRDLGLIYLSIFLWGMGSYLYYYLQPLYVTQLGASPEQVGLALGLGGFVVTFLYAPIGLWADRYGRKQIVLLGWTLGTLATFAMTIAPDWRWFTPALAAYALSNFAMAVLYGYITSSAPAGRRAEVFATLSIAGSLGSIVAPAIGGWIGETFGLRAVYLAAALLYTASTIAMLPLSPQPIEPHASRSHAWTLLRNRGFAAHILFVFCLFFATDVGLVLAPKYLGEVRALTLNEIGWLGTWGAIGIMVLLYGLSRLRGEGLRAMLIGLLLAISGLVLLFVGQHLALLVIAFLINGGNRLIRPSLLFRIGRLLSPTTLSFGLGIQQTAMQLGLAASPYVAGLLYARNPAWPFYAGIGSLSIMVLIVVGIMVREQTAAALVSPEQASG